MTKPFEFAVLKQKLVGQLKQLAKPAAEAVIDWTAESCALHANGIVKGIGGVLVAVKPTVLAEIEKAVQ